MNTTFKLLPLLLVGAIGGGLTVSEPAVAQDNDQTTQTPRAEADSQSAETQSVQPQVQNEGQEEARKQRERITQEAVDALGKTHEALKALDEERTDDALEALAVATGKLELLVARDPKLGLAPVDVRIDTYDLYASTDTLKQAIDAAKGALSDGRVQDARTLLQNLASEMVISVTNIPLATYPEAIKAITPLIDAGELDEAQRLLTTALSTLVIEKAAIPLPALRGKQLLVRAEELAEKENRTDAENTELKTHIDEVRTQFEMAEILGYAEKSSFQPLYDQLEEIVDRTKDGKSGTGFFDNIKRMMSRFGD